MGLESATYLDELVTTNPVGSTDPKSQGDNHLRLIKSALKSTFPGLAGRAWRVQTKSADYQLIATDNMSVIAASAAITFSALAAATLGNGYVVILTAPDDDCVFDPNSTELVNGATTLDIPAGSTAVVFCTGSAFFAMFLPNQAVGNGKQMLSWAQINQASLVLEGTDKRTFKKWPKNFEIDFVQLEVVGASASAITFDITVNGSSIFTNKLVIDGGEFTTQTAGTQPSLTTTTIAAGDTVETHCDDEGDGAAVGWTIYMYGNWVD